MAQPFRAPLDAVAATVPVSPVQSATIVAEISGKLERWVATKNPNQVIVPGMPDVSLLPGGTVWWCRGRAVPPARVVTTLGALLASLLDHTAAHRAPAGLLYVVARATDPRHLAPFANLAEFHRTLARYAASRPSIAVDALVARFAVARSGLPPLGPASTIADVRRLRRASGVPLGQIASDTAIPISLLRELEWGVYTYWNLEHARGAVELYAERAGLEGDAVVRVIEHEQAHQETEPESPVLLPAATHVARSPERGRMPFALAALLMGAVLLAPGDRSAPPVSIPVAHESLATERSPEIVPTALPPETDRLQPPAPPAVTHAPSVRRIQAPQRRRRSPEKPQHPLLRFARAIAGDGRYKVEPFPKVQ